MVLEETLAWQVQQAIDNEQSTKVATARRMKTTRVPRIPQSMHHPGVTFIDCPVRKSVTTQIRDSHHNSHGTVSRASMLKAMLVSRISLGVLLLYPGMFFSYPASAYAQQPVQLQWQDNNFFTEADRREIPALARIIGMRNPNRVIHGEFIPSSCPYAMIESTYSESGQLRTYLQLMVYRNDWKCMRPVKGKSKRVGRWFANSTDLETRREWKVEEDQWVKYVPFSDGVSYEDAETIILAIKHRQVVDRSLRNALPSIDSMDIASIQVKASADRTFEVTTSNGGSGEIYLIRLNDHNVELLETQIWIA